MINFLLDFSLSKAALMINCLCTIIAIIMAAIIIYKRLWDFRLPLVTFVIGLILFGNISILFISKDKETTIFFNELENKYNYNFVRTKFEKENAGIVFCSFYDFKNPTCKNYIQYFIVQRLADKKESEEKEQAKIIEAEKKEQERVNEEERIKNNIRETLPSILSQQRSENETN